MANIDVSDLLLDPDFVDTVSVIRRTTAINSYGENVVSEPTTIVTVASVQPASFKQIQRLPDALRIADVRSFYIKIPIILDSTTTYPDVIVYRGKRFQVQTSAHWLNFGAGWCEAVCVAEKPS